MLLLRLLLMLLLLMLLLLQVLLLVLLLLLMLLLLPVHLLPQLFSYIINPGNARGEASSFLSLRYIWRHLSFPNYGKRSSRRKYYKCLLGGVLLCMRVRGSVRVRRGR
jgi:hypothetical protein